MADTSLKHAASLVPVGAFAGKPAMPLTRSAVVIGSGPHARFLLKSDTVSTSHALVIHTASGWYFRDLVSRTHTILNGKSLRESPIKSGDTLTIGKFVFSFVSVGKVEELPPAPPAALEITDAEIPVPIDTRSMLIGRRVGCEIRLIEESVSLVHAAIFEQDGTHYIRDLYSRTGTFLNGKKIHQEPLKFGDVVVIGETTIRYVPDEQLYAQPMPGETAQDRNQLVELEPFGVAEPAAAAVSVGDDSLLNGSLSDGSVLGGSVLGASAAGASAIGASAMGAPAISQAVEALTPVAPQPELEPAEIASPSDESLADVAVVPLNRRDAFAAPADAEPLEIADEYTIAPALKADALVPAPADEAVGTAHPETIAGSLDAVAIGEGLEETALDEAAAPEALDALSLAPADDDVGTAHPETVAGSLEAAALDVDGQERNADDVAVPLALALAPADEDVGTAHPETIAESLDAVALDVAAGESEVAEDSDALSLAPADDDVATAHPETITGSLDSIALASIESADDSETAAADIEDEVLGLPSASAPEPEFVADVTEPAGEVFEAHDDVRDDLRLEPIADLRVAELPVPSTPEPAAPAYGLPFAAADHEAHGTDQEHTLAEPIFAHAIIDQPVVPDVSPQPQAVIADDAHTDAIVAEDPIEPPAAEPDALPPSREVTELAALQARINAALTDPSAMSRQPLLAEERDAPAPRMSEAARRAHVLAQLLESNEEFEDEAERESQAIAFAPSDEAAAEQATPAAEQPADEEAIAAPTLELAPVTVELPTLASIEAPGTIEFEIASDAPSVAADAEADLEAVVEPDAEASADTESAEFKVASAELPVDSSTVETAPEIEAQAEAEIESDIAANVVEPAGPAALAELIRIADAGVPVATHDVASEAGPLSLAAGESAVIGDEDDLVAAAPAVDDLTTPDETAFVEANASAEAVAIEAESDVEPLVRAEPLTVEPLALESQTALVTPDEPVSESAADIVLDTPASLVADASIAEVSISDAAVNDVTAEADLLDADLSEAAPTAKGRRSKKGPPPRARKAASTRKPPKAKRPADTVEEATAAALAAAAAIEPTPADADTIVIVSTSAPANDSADSAATDASVASPFSDDQTVDALADATAGVSDAVTIEAAPEVAADLASAASEPSITIAASSDDSLEVATPAADATETETAAAAIEAIVDAAAPTTLDAIAHATPPQPLPVDEVLVPSRLAAEPDELATQIDDDRAPVEADAVNAGEVILTTPVTLRELPVENVAPMIDPDRGAIAERDAIDGIDDPDVLEVLEANADAHSVESEFVAEADDADLIENEFIGSAGSSANPTEAGTVVIVDEDDELTPLDPSSRPLMAAEDEAAIAVEEEDQIGFVSDAESDAEIDTAGSVNEFEVASGMGDVSAMADAVEPALDTGLTTEPGDAAIRVGLDVESLAVLDAAAEPAVVGFTQVDAEVADAPGEALAVAGEQLATVDDELAAPAVEGNWLASADATVAAALADALPEAFVPGATEAEPTVELSVEAHEPADAPMTMEFAGSMDLADADEPLIAEPAPLDGSTLSAASLPMDTGNETSIEADVENDFSDTVDDELPRDVIGRIGMADGDERNETPLVSQSRPSPTEDILGDAWGYAPSADAPPASTPNFQPAHAPRPVQPGAVAMRGGNTPTSIVNVKVPALEDLEASFHDAFADALAMAEGGNFAKPKPTTTPADQAGANGAATSANKRPAPPKWELDESLLDQANTPAANPMAGALGGPAGFMSLGGIGWIGDESTDEYEATGSSLRPASDMGGLQPLRGTMAGQIGGAMAARRASRRRRPVGEATAESQSQDVPTNGALANGATTNGATVETTDELAELLSEQQPADVSPAADTRMIAPRHDHVFAERAVTIDDELAKLVDEPALGQPAAEKTIGHTMPAVELPRPVRRPRTPIRADVDETLAAAASASPFAEQTLPLVDAFSGTATPPSVDEVLSRLGAPEGRVHSTPTITQDRPTNGNGAGLSSPFASHASIESVPSSGVRRTRQRINKLPLLLMLMTGLMAVATLGAWYWPVPITVRGEVAFANLDRVNELDRANYQDKIRGKLAQLDQPARQMLDDRYGNGFLDRRELYTVVIENARFDPSLPGTLVVDHRSSINQVEGDVARMNALVSQIVKANQDLVDAQRKLQDTARTLERSIARDRDRRASLAAEVERARSVATSGPDGKELRRVETETEQLEAARKAAAQDVDAKEAELKRLEANALVFVPVSMIQDELATMIADVSEGLPSAPATTRPADARAELARLIAQHDATKARLDQLDAALNPETKKARDGFDAALEAFAGDVEAARTTLGDQPEVLKYVESAQRLQDQIRQITDTLVRRQQQQLTRMNELKQRLADLNGANRDQRVSGDEELRKWNDQIAINERLLNSSRDDNGDPESIAKLDAQVRLLKTMVAAKEESLKDPRAESVDKQLEEMLRTTRREMDADRADNEKMLADIQEAFRSQQPAVEQLPNDQKKLGEALAGRLAQIDLARQRYADSLVHIAGGDALQVTELRKKADDLKAQIAKQQALVDVEVVAQTADMQRRAEAAKLVDAARANVVAARTARDQAAAAHEAKAKALASLVERREAASAARQRVEQIEAEDKDLQARMSQAIADQRATELRLATAVVPDPVRGPSVRAMEPPHGDPRFAYGLSGIALIALIFGSLLYRENRNRPVVARPADDEVDVLPSRAHIA